MLLKPQFIITWYFLFDSDNVYSYLLYSQSINLFKSKKNFFELLRFDFLMDENQNLYLMEINMSPNITPTEQKYEKNAKIREKMVYDVVSLAGVGSEFDLMSRWVFVNKNSYLFWTFYIAHSYNQQSLDMISNLPNIAIDLEQCFMNNCERNCQKTECKLCATCWDDDDMRNLLEAHREHSRRGGFKRVFPSTTQFDENFIHKLSKENKISTRWFAAKCREDPEWC